MTLAGMTVVTVEEREQPAGASPRWGLSALVGVLFLVLGYPDETLKVLSLFLGWFLLLAGASAVPSRDRVGSPG